MSGSARLPEAVERSLRRRLPEAGAALLAGRGLAGDLLARAAERAVCPEEHARRFFGRDEELVLALYARLAGDLESVVPELPPGTVAERFRAVMAAKFALVAPYRPALAALAAVLLDPRHELGALSPQTEIIRNRVRGVFAAAVHGATDRPPDADDLARVLYGLHLGLMLLWTQDTTPDTRAARTALDVTRDALGFLVPLLGSAATSPVLGRLDAVFRPLLEPEESGDVAERATAILRCLFRHRRLLPGAGTCAAEPCGQCLALHLPKVKYFVRAGVPIHLVLPSFPAKSPSRRKTLGPLPDRAEELALLYLDRACGEVAALHPAGVRLTLCSDGHVFSDLVGVSDADVTRYGGEIRAMLRRLGEILEWEFGAVNELQARPDARNYLYTVREVPFHWDGAFVGRVPHYIFFHCRVAPPLGPPRPDGRPSGSADRGGETVFCDTVRLLQRIDPEEREHWRHVRVTYSTEKVVHYGGQPAFLARMHALLNDPALCYPHAWRAGDILLADNHALLHGRRAFTLPGERHLRRVNIL